MYRHYFYTNVIKFWLLFFCVGYNFVTYTMEQIQTTTKLLDLPADVIRHIGLAKTKQYRDIIEALPVTEKLVQVNKYLYTLLSSESKKYKFLLKMANAYDSNGETTLLKAIENRNLKEILNLINNGANIDQPSKNGWDTPLYCVVANNNTDITHLLLKYGADAQCDKHENRHERALTPFFHAIREGYLDIAQLLLDYGADINKSNHYFNRTPLHTAVCNSQIELIKFLLKNGANKYLVDNNNKNARDLTTNEEIITLLEQDKIG
jgi:ankyrin repeat protein